MKIGIILETKEFEKAWNAFRFAITATSNQTPFLAGFSTLQYFLVIFVSYNIIICTK